MVQNYEASKKVITYSFFEKNSINIAEDRYSRRTYAFKSTPQTTGTPPPSAGTQPPLHKGFFTKKARFVINSGVN